MKTKALRLYGKNDLRLEEFELPPIKNDEILACVISDCICMSSYKAVIQGVKHKRIPKDIDKKPIIIGHEFCGKIIESGEKWRYKFKPGQKFAIQPKIYDKNNPFAAPGYSYEFMGGAATYIIISNIIMEQKCLLDYNGDAYFYGSLAEPVSCIVRAFHENYHSIKNSYKRKMGISKNGKLAILGGAGPMGMGAIDYAIHGDRKPSLVVVTDINDNRLKEASEILTVEDAKKNNLELLYINTSEITDPEAFLLSITEGKGFDDVFIFAPIKSLVEMGDRILGKDGCLNFFAGPTDPKFSAMLNFYNIHYNSTHIIGTSGGNTKDLSESLKLIETGRINPSSMITHIGGLNCVAETILNLPNIPGGKKLIYTHINLDLTELKDFEEKGNNNKLFAKLDEIVNKNNGFWCTEAEKYLLANALPI